MGEGTELVVPGSGEVVSLDNAQDCAATITYLRDLETDIKAAKRELTDALVSYKERIGKPTFEVGLYKITVSADSGTTYDAEAIEQGLRELGMPEERIREIVVEEITYKVNPVEAKRAAKANPAYAKVIEAASTPYVKSPYVRIGR
jgi:hypothetical protein